MSWWRSASNDSNKKEAAAAADAAKKKSPSPPLSLNPTPEQCAIYKLNADFVISNLKFSLVHHTARTDGTMLNAWKEEEAMLKDQLKVLEGFPDNPKLRQIRDWLNEDLAENQRHQHETVEPEEVKRMERMRDMHRTMVDSLESLIPLLKEKCP
ncbi:DUF148 domain-containing protein [Balamuthia mandrillaris]